MYCVKCKRETNTTNPVEVTTKNNRRQLRGKCSICGTTKTQFIKSGKGVINKMINALPMEMHLPGHQFTGPGTRLDKRLKADGTPQPWSKPINRVDEIAMQHDICYKNNKDTKTRNKICDTEMLKKLDGIYNPTLRERMDRAIVKPIIGTKKHFGWGLKKI